MRRPHSIATSLVVVLTLAVSGCNSTWHISGALGSASISGQVSQIRITVTSHNGSSVNVTVVTFLNPVGISDPAAERTFCGHIADRFTMNAVHTVTFDPGPACGNVVTVKIG